MYSKIMVGTDGSETAKKAVDNAIELCKSLGAELIAVSAVNMAPVSGIEKTDGKTYNKIRDEFEQHANEILDEVEKKAAKENLMFKRIVKLGDPADVIVEQAKREKADLIVIGTKGLMGVQRVVLGSHAEKIVRWSPIPVLVVR
ncbi:MAG: universal stress protein [Candidatus Freyarchaeum deiterrae]